MSEKTILYGPLSSDPRLAQTSPLPAKAQQTCRATMKKVLPLIKLQILRKNQQLARIKYSKQELSQQNLAKGSYKKLDVYKRKKSSESSYEGTYMSKARQVFLEFPYAFARHNYRQGIRRFWRKFIIAVVAVMRYNRLLIYKKLKRNLPRSYKIIYKQMQFPSEVHRKIKRSNALLLPDKQPVIEEPEVSLIKQLFQKKIKSQSYKKSTPNFIKTTYYQDFRQSTQRLSRVICHEERIRSVPEMQMMKGSRAERLERTAHSPCKSSRMYFLLKRRNYQSAYRSENLRLIKTIV